MCGDIVNVLSIFKSKSIDLKLPKYDNKGKCALVFLYNASTKVLTIALSWNLKHFHVQQ